MPRQYSVFDAQNNLPNIIEEVENSTLVELTQRGRPVAVLLSIKEYRRLRPTETEPPKRDFWEALQEFRAKYDLEDLDIDDVFSDVRDRSPGREVEF